MDSDQSSSGSFGLLFLAVLIDLLGFGIIIPVLPFLVKDINPAQEGLLLALLLSSYSLAQFLSAPFWGRLSDRIGRRPIILVGLIGSAISFAMFGLVTTYPLFLASRVIAGLFTGATLPTARAYVADITPPDERARRYGLLGAAFGIGFTFGPAIGSLLSLDIFLIPGLPEQAPPSLFAALLALINFILARTRLPESLTKVEDQIDFEQVSPVSTLQSTLSMASNKQIATLLIIFGFSTLVFSGFESILALFANTIDTRITEDNIGYFFALVGILVAVIQSTLVGPVVDLLGEDRTILAALGCQIIGFILMSVTSSIWFLGIVIVPLALGTALLNPSINSAISNRIADTEQGSGLGINSSVGSLGRVIGPIFAGLLYDEFYPAAPFSVGALLLVLVLILGLFTLLSSDRATKYCMECGTAISEDVTTCPTCGVEIYRP